MDLGPLECRLPGEKQNQKRVTEKLLTGFKKLLKGLQKEELNSPPCFCSRPAWSWLNPRSGACPVCGTRSPMPPQHTRTPMTKSPPQGQRSHQTTAPPYLWGNLWWNFVTQWSTTASQTNRMNWESQLSLAVGTQVKNAFPWISELIQLPELHHGIRKRTYGFWTGRLGLWGHLWHVTIPVEADHKKRGGSPTHETVTADAGLTCR